MAVRFVQELRLLSPTIARYFVTIAVVGFAIDGGIYAVLLNLYLLRLDYGPEQIGLINAAGTFTFGLCSLPAGALGARWGSRRMLLLGLVMLLVGCVLIPLADMLAPAWRLPWLLVNQVVLYIGLALYFVNTAPYILEVVSPARRNQIFSLQTALLSLAAFVGSLVGGLLPPAVGALLGASTEQPAPYRYALLVAGLAVLPALLAFRGARPNPVDGKSDVVTATEPAADVAAIPPAATAILGLLALIALVRLLQVSGLAALTTFFNVYLDRELLLPTAQIGAIIACARLLGVPAALATSALTARFGNRAVVIGASLGTALSILPIALIPHWGAASLSFVGVIGLSWIRYAASTVYFLELVPPSRRATVSGVTEMAAGITFTVLAYGGGYAIERFGYRSLFLAGAALTGLSALVFWRAFWRRPSTGRQ
jgi:MFS family permease